MNSINLRGMQLHKEWPWDCKFGKCLIKTLVNYIPDNDNFRLIMDKICHLFLHIVSVNLGVIFNKCFAEFFFVNAENV